MEPIKLNSLVQLNSGGPIMTVDSFANKLEAGNPLTSRRIADESWVDCEWFEGSSLRQGTFEVTTLRPVSEDEREKAPSEEAIVLAYTGLNRKI
ncbi:DUF2158 domain-containing protein [Spirosoma arcticum]